MAKSIATGKVVSMIIDSFSNARRTH